MIEVNSNAVGSPFTSGQRRWQQDPYRPEAVPTRRRLTACHFFIISYSIFNGYYIHSMLTLKVKIYSFLFLQSDKGQ